MNNVELLPCPFCGKLPFWFEYHENKKHIGCNNPSCILHGYSFKGGKWNTRTPSPSVRVVPLIKDIMNILNPRLHGYASDIDQLELASAIRELFLRGEV